MNPIKNIETENFCQLVANEYQVNPLKANQIFVDFVNSEQWRKNIEQKTIKAPCKVLISTLKQIKRSILFYPASLSMKYKNMPALTSWLCFHLILNLLWACYRRSTFDLLQVS